MKNNREIENIKKMVFHDNILGLINLKYLDKLFFKHVTVKVKIKKLQRKLHKYGYNLQIKIKE